MIKSPVTPKRAITLEFDINTLQLKDTKLPLKYINISFKLYTKAIWTTFLKYVVL